MVAPVVISFITKHVRDNGMNMAGLGSLLQRESATYRSALPSGLSDTLWPATGAWPATTAAAGATASPVVAQSIRRETSSTWLLPALAAGAVALGLIWLLSHGNRPTEVRQAAIPTPRGEAARVATPPSVTCALPATVIVPAGGVESRLLAFVQDPNAPVVGNNWFNTNQLEFANGSARLGAGSQGELQYIAQIMENCPNVRMTVAGYTDNVGKSDSNLRLSRNRAGAVVDDLVAKGVSRDRLHPEGFGDQDPVADNATSDGRAQNRRVALCVTQK
jgi:outer membrane protein OmpA-like peptidoglycan-associated protein